MGRIGEGNDGNIVEGQEGAGVGGGEGQTICWVYLTKGLDSG